MRVAPRGTGAGGGDGFLFFWVMVPLSGIGRGLHGGDRRQSESRRPRVALTQIAAVQCDQNHAIITADARCRAPPGQAGGPEEGEPPTLQLVRRR